MIVEERIYTLHPGMSGAYLKNYEENGLPVQLPILGNLIGYFATEFGPLNQIIHIWGYDSFDERARRRGILMSDDRWQAYLKTSRPMIRAQENKFLIPAPFSPVGGSRPATL
jgi:hypothetical protein